MIVDLSYGQLVAPIGCATLGCVDRNTDELQISLQVARKFRRSIDARDRERLDHSRETSRSLSMQLEELILALMIWLKIGRACGVEGVVLYVAAHPNHYAAELTRCPRLGWLAHHDLIRVFANLLVSGSIFFDEV